jgi:hypothetical protein
MGGGNARRDRGARAGWAGGTAAETAGMLIGLGT